MPTALYYSLIVLSFTASFLLFFLEPMFAKFILPSLGGAANVWIAATTFYQVMLFVGYGYAHFLTRLPWKAQFAVHAFLLIAAVLFLPVVVPANWTPPTNASPALSMLLMMAQAVGVPFILLAATAPLLQSWHALLSDSDDSYRLYSFSNVGSFLALFAYPFLAEPRLTLSQQSAAFSFTYIIFVSLFIISIGFIITRFCVINYALEQKRQKASAEKLPSGSTLFWWIFLSAVPASLMLSTTTFITADVGGMPLFWLIPLGLYLLCFIISFSEGADLAYRLSAKIYPTAVVAFGVGLTPSLSLGFLPRSIMIIIAVIIIFFISAILCTSRLAQSKPRTENLTYFYLCIAFGGALGGAFNSIIAPALFSGAAEYQIGLSLTCIALPFSSKKYNIIAINAIWIAFSTTLFAIHIYREIDVDNLVSVMMYIGIASVAAISVFYLRTAPALFAIGIGAIFLAGVLSREILNRHFIARSFYGVSRVSNETTIGARLLLHGTTIHGAMSLAEGQRLTPLSYYSSQGGMGQALISIGASNKSPRIAVIGLGTGALKCFGTKEWHFDFYELDPVVSKIADNVTLFPFLRECPASYSIILGDGRLKIRSAPAKSYDAVIVDAYSSDAIPVHLLTVEALAEFTQKLAPEGVLLLHLTNRFFDLPPIAIANARHLNLFLAEKRHASVGTLDQLIFPSDVIALAPTDSPIRKLKEIGWSSVEPSSVEIWTDGKSDVISPLIRHWFSH